LNCPYQVCDECKGEDSKKPAYWNWKSNNESTMIDFDGYLFDLTRTWIRVHMFSATYLCNGKKNDNVVSAGKIVQTLGALM
jgi:hypothetical protein